VADDDPLTLLARTDQALATRNYEGVFVHEHAGYSETLRVVHRVGPDGVSERLQSMDGSGREVIRKGNQLTCYLPDQRTALVENTSDTGLLLGSLPRVDAASASLYQVTELPKARVSGRAARVIAVEPMDQMRYGYRVWIDEASSMPLKTQLRSSSGDVLEQIIFTTLRLPSHIPDSQLQPAVDAHNYRWVQHLADSADVRGLAISWEASVLPPGFRMTANARQVLRSGPVEHLVFTDGLASVSVFVEIGRPRRTDHANDDAATIGSSSAYSTTVQGYRVTAVGEVPPDTVRAIARSIRAEAAVPTESESLLGSGGLASGSLGNAVHRPEDSSSIFDEYSGNDNGGRDDDAHGWGGGGRVSFGNAGLPAGPGMPGGGAIPGGAVPAAVPPGVGPGRH
jgi:sigma-E factor negative regulatory protein RseB